MTYGVDQCRCCGVPIKPKGPQVLEDYNQSLRRPPTMPEAEWRRRGYLAAPTKQQIKAPGAGCCQPCGERQVLLHVAPFARLRKVILAAIAAIIVVATLTVWLAQ